MYGVAAFKFNSGCCFVTDKVHVQAMGQQVQMAMRKEMIMTPWHDRCAAMRNMAINMNMHEGAQKKHTAKMVMHKGPKKKHRAKAEQK